MKEYASYLFDADGTLIDTRELIYRSFLHMTRTLNLPEPDRVVVDSLIGLPMRPQLERFVGPGKTDEEYAEAYSFYNDFHMKEFHRYLGIFPGIKEGLETLRNLDKKLAVVSSRSGRTLKAFLEVLEIAEYFSVVVSSNDTEKHKPHPEPALRGLELLDADASTSVFIGDAEFDMSCGKAAGMDVAYVAWGGMDYVDWPVKPDYVATTFTDLLPDEA